MRKILYLYNSENWAIHNVGKLWFKDVTSVEVTLKNYHRIDENELKNYDFVWYGYMLMYLKMSSDIKTSIFSLHDPLELFPQTPDWKSLPPIPERLDLLKRAKRVVTASKELQDILSSLHIPSALIPTTSLLPLRNRSSIKTAEAKTLSVFEDYPRKNSALFNEIGEICEKELKIKFHHKLGKQILPKDQYIKLLDSHEIYICSSYQEGGPLPAIDAMKRGMVVITTKVGQIQELITDGYNGFFCENKEEFIEKIKLLSSNLDLLQKMRLNSIAHVQKERNRELIKKHVDQFITSKIIN